MVAIDIDSDGVWAPWMFRTLLRIVAEELRAAAAVPARITPLITHDRLEWLEGTGAAYPAEAELTG